MSNHLRNYLRFWKREEKIASKEESAPEDYHKPKAGRGYFSDYSIHRLKMINHDNMKDVFNKDKRSKNLDSLLNSILDEAGYPRY